MAKFKPKANRPDRPKRPDKPIAPSILRRPIHHIAIKAPPVVPEKPPALFQYLSAATHQDLIREKNIQFS
jgi:hypothetical protein